MRSFALDTSIELLVEGIIHHPNSRFLLDGKAERDANIGMEVEEVVRAVDWINDESRFIS